jgi:hypothetical protein
MVPDFIEEYNNSYPQKQCDELIKWFDLCSDKNFTKHNVPMPDGPQKRSVRSDEQMIVRPIVHRI